jgi:hypothetical protein
MIGRCLSTAPDVERRVTMGARWVRPWLILGLAGLLTACADAMSRSAELSVPIASFASVAGTWEGSWNYTPDRDVDWLRLTIREDGSFDAESYRIIGSFKASGMLVLADGKVVFHGERGGSASATLMVRDSARWLDIEALTGRGIRTTAKLERVHP